MRLLHPHYLYLLLLLIPLILLLLRRDSFRRRRFGSYAQDAFYTHSYRRVSPFFSSLKLSLLIAAFALIIVALAQPQWDFGKESFESSGLDIICCIDVSKSMDATDISPSRLTRAKLQLSSFIRQLEGDRIGIVAFAGHASLECPLTDDYESVQMVLNSLSSETISTYGTDIGAALDVGLRAFNSIERGGIMFLLSDGEDLEDKALKRAKELADMGITIYTMGVGSPAGSYIKNPASGEEILTKPDIESLKKIAAVTGGKFYAVTPSQNEIDQLLRQIYGRERSKLATREVNLMKDQYRLFLILALGLILLECLISPLRKKQELR